MRAGNVDDEAMSQGPGASNVCMTWSQQRMHDWQRMHDMDKEKYVLLAQKLQEQVLTVGC